MARSHLTLEEFQKRFPTDAECGDFLIGRRWPNGFSCPACGALKHSKLVSRAHTFECLECGRQTSITAGTILHRTKLPLTKWFWAAHLLATHSNGMSALQLKTQIGVNYRTAWLLLHKLRLALVDPGRELLQGFVEVDATELTFREANPSDPDTDGTIYIMGAVEVIDRHSGLPPKLKPNGLYLDTRSGRARLELVRREDKVSVHRFIRDNVAPGAILLTDGHASYLGLNLTTDPNRYIHDSRPHGIIAAHLVMPWIHRVFSLLKRYGMGTFHGFRRKHMETYLNEFVFRYNRRRHRGISFEKVLGLAVQHQQQGYWDLIDRANPRLKKPKNRDHFRRRKTAIGMRQDSPEGARKRRERSKPVPESTSGEPGTDA
jgi:predicted RNA-binding Zn-ribbon protein involved in translation (DUF1610 family)